MTSDVLGLDSVPPLIQQPPVGLRRYLRPGVPSRVHRVELAFSKKPLHMIYIVIPIV